MSDSVLFLPVDQLEPNPFQPRNKVHRPDLEDLVTSIKSYGILEPLVIAETPAGYQIIAGERRWRAAKEAGLKEVPVIVKKTTPRGMLEMAIVENVQRVDLNPIERAQAFLQLNRDFGFSATTIAEKVGKSIPYVSNSLKLLEMPDAIKDGIVGGQITEGHARALSSINDPKLMIECYKIILKENASVRRAEDLSRRFREEAGQPMTHAGRSIALPDEQLKVWQNKFQSHFHTKAVLKLSRSRNSTRISINLKGTPEETQADLEKLLSWAEENDPTN
jgi:ParB family chromosome partitioning protein